MIPWETGQRTIPTIESDFCSVSEEGVEIMRCPKLANFSFGSSASGDPLLTGVCRGSRFVEGDTRSWCATGPYPEEGAWGCCSERCDLSGVPLSVGCPGGRTKMIKFHAFFGDSSLSSETQLHSMIFWRVCLVGSLSIKTHTCLTIIAYTVLVLIPRSWGLKQA